MSVYEMTVLVNEVALGIPPEESAFAPLPEEMSAFRAETAEWMSKGYAVDMPFDS